jgi:hypothetical protein
MSIENCRCALSGGKGNDQLIRRRYYEGGVSSVYFWNLDDGFAGVVLLKKSS